MRWFGSILPVLLLAGIAFCAEQTQSPAPENQPQAQSENIPLLPCGQGQPGIVACLPSKQQLKEAKAAFSKGLKLQRAKHPNEAFEEFDKAARLVPRNVDYVTAREMMREQVVYDDLERGNKALLDGRQTEALAAFRGALQLDPKNEFAQQRLRDAVNEWSPKASGPPRVVTSSGELHVAPNAVNADFHYVGNTKDLLTQVAGAFGVKVIFDESVVSRQVRFDITNVDFYSAMSAASAVTHTFWTPLQLKEILVAAESAENHRKFDRMAMRTFYLPGVTTPADLTSVVNLLRNLFEIRLITPQPKSGTLVVRAPQNLLDAATQFLENLDASRPEVMLDVRVYQINHSFMRNLGLQIPNQFQMFNIPAGALAALGGQNIQDLINQLISGGGINQANSQAISALLAQLQSQQNSIFSQPLATFGNGKTLMGVSLGTVGAQLALNESWVKNLEHATLRVAQGNDAAFRVGSRYPILNATFAPIFNSSAISQVLQNNSFQAPFPSFSYEDLGLSMKAKPTVSSDLVVGLHLEIQLRTLVGQSINGVPVIANREFEGSMSLVDGEPAVVAGAVTRSEQRSLTGLPGMGAVPGLNKVMTSNSQQNETDELLVVITPRVVRSSEHGEATEVWLPQ
jgi:general secretion pathway protein D